MLFGIKTQGLARLLRAARKENLTVSIFTAEDMRKVPITPGKGKVCPPPTYAGVRVIEVDDVVKLMLANEEIIEVSLNQIRGIRTKELAELSA